MFCELSVRKLVPSANGEIIPGFAVFQLAGQFQGFVVDDGGMFPKQMELHFVLKLFHGDKI